MENPSSGKPPRLKLRPLVPTEKEEQAAFVHWLQLAKIVFYAIPNGEKRDLITAVQLKRQGVKAGVPDLCIPLARKGHHGLYIELKRVSGGVVSAEQEKWIDLLTKNGYKALVCLGWIQAKEAVEDYLGMNPCIPVAAASP